MASVDRLKAKARQAEAKQNWKSALEFWNQILSMQASGKVPNALDLAEYNRVGDLHLKVGEPAKASDFFETAADRYIESGFQNNAIALCNKVLRYAPGRVHVYLKLAKLLVQKGFVAEGKQHFLTYAERMQKAGREGEAVAALRELSTLAPNSAELKALLDQYGVRDGRAVDQDVDPEYQVDGPLSEEREKRSRKTRSLVFLSLDEEPPVPVARPTSAGAKLPGDLPLIAPEAVDEEVEERIRVSEAEIARRESIASPEVEVETAGIEITPTEIAEGAEADEEVTVEGLDIVPTEIEEDQSVAEPTVSSVDGLQSPLDDEVARRTGSVEGLEATEADVSLDPADFEAEPISGLEIESAPEFEVAVAGPTETEARAEQRKSALAGLSVIPVEDESPGVPELEALVAERPDDANAHQRLGEALIEEGERERGIEELEIAASQFDAAAALSEAREVLEEIVRLEPNSVTHLQKLVELSFRAKDRQRLIGSYLALADALVRLGAVEKAMAVYDRVLEHDPENQSARSAMDLLRPSAGMPMPGEAGEPDIKEEIRSARMQVRDEAPRDGTGFVDFRDMVLDEEPTDSRMRVEEGEPTGDEERDFVDILDQFRKGIDETIEAEDYQAHYDLGIAFKEMGLLDDAISEFQKALRASTGQLMTTEALGTCFFEKEQYVVAESILRRGLEYPASGEQERIGVLYWLARSLEAQHKTGDALEHYQRVVAIDIRFADVESRVRQLAGAGS